MAMTAMRGGQACFRMPGPLLALLYELGSPGAKPLPLTRAGGFDTREHRRWGVIEQVMIPDPDVTHNPDPVPAISITEWGSRLYSVLPMQRPRDRRSLPPLIPVARLLAVCSDEDRTWLRQQTPLVKTDRGSLFRALGVITDAARGDCWVSTTFLQQGFAQYDSGRDGPTLVNPFLNPAQARFLRKALIGITAADAAETDGRTLKPLGQGYMGLVVRDDAGSYQIPPSVRPFVRVAAVAANNPIALFEALPTRDQEWLAEECETAPSPHHYLLDKMGWVYFKTGRWNLTPMARDLLPSWQSIVSAPIGGVELPHPDDFSILDGPDDIYMPDDEQMDADIYALAAEMFAPDPFDALDMTPSNPDSRAVGKHPALGAPYSILDQEHGEYQHFTGVDPSTITAVLPGDLHVAMAANPLPEYPHAPPPRIDTVRGEQRVVSATDSEFDIL